MWRWELTVKSRKSLAVNHRLTLVIKKHRLHLEGKRRRRRRHAWSISSISPEAVSLLKPSCQKIAMFIISARPELSFLHLWNALQDPHRRHMPHHCYPLGFQIYAEGGHTCQFLPVRKARQSGILTWKCRQNLLQTFHFGDMLPYFSCTPLAMNWDSHDHHLPNASHAIGKEDNKGARHNWDASRQKE